jgi:hypothetical protein
VTDDGTNVPGITTGEYGKTDVGGTVMVKMWLEIGVTT